MFHLVGKDRQLRERTDCQPGTTPDKCFAFRRATRRILLGGYACKEKEGLVLSLQFNLEAQTRDRNRCRGAQEKL